MIFPDAETPLFSTFDFLPMLKHHCSTLFVLPIAEKLQSDNSSLSSSTKQHHPTIVSPHFLLLLKHHCSTVLHIFSSLKQHRPTIVSFFSIAETPLFNTFCSPYFQNTTV
jgi:hypothetical protein